MIQNLLILICDSFEFFTITWIHGTSNKVPIIRLLVFSRTPYVLTFLPVVYTVAVSGSQSAAEESSLRGGVFFFFSNKPNFAQILQSTSNDVCAITSCPNKAYIKRIFFPM